MNQLIRKDPATSLQPKSKKETGSVFVSNYPPFSNWSQKAVPHALKPPPEAFAGFALSSRDVFFRISALCSWSFSTATSCYRKFIFQLNDFLNCITRQKSFLQMKYKTTWVM